MNPSIKKCIALVIVLLCVAASALAEVVLEEKGLSLGENTVHYLQVSGMEDQTIQEQVNAQLLAASHAQEYVSRMALLLSSPVGIQCDYEVLDSACTGDVLSVIFTASGALEDIGATHLRRCVNIDLRTGEVIPLSALFADEERTKAAILAYMAVVVEPELSAHLAAADLSELPADYAISAEGITFCYPIQKLCTLSDESGMVHIGWFELREYLNLEEDAALTRMGANDLLTLDAEVVAAQVSKASFPGQRVTLCDSIA